MVAAAAEDNLYISSRSWSPAIFMYRQNIFMHRQNVFIHKQNVFMHRRKENDLNKAFKMGVATGSASAFSEELAKKCEVERLLKEL